MQPSGSSAMVHVLSAWGMKLIDKAYEYLRGESTTPPAFAPRMQNHSSP